tara:strand:+ start:425 stop:694 length:270 start_codon:yes stop_codon:yes gene_type:complete
MPKFLNNVPDDWDNYWTRCEGCGARIHASDGVCCEPEPDTGKADTFDGFQDQLDELSEDQWETLQRLMYASECPKLVAFFEGLELTPTE